MDIIVFNQKELDNASAARSIALCDNDFNIAPSENTEYTAIGKVNAVVGCSAVRAVALGMTFIGFTPVFDEDLKIQKIPQPCFVPTSFSGSFKSSFHSSFTTSYTTSYKTSFSGMYEYEYEYRRGSFKGSFVSSFSGSFRMKTSFAVGSMGAILKLKRKYVVREISVNGYGLNLI